MKTHNKASLSLVCFSAALLFSSCIDYDYDLSQINTDIAIENISSIIQKEQVIRVSDFFNLDTKSIIYEDGGNISFQVEGEPLTKTYTLEKFSLNQYGNTVSKATIAAATTKGSATLSSSYGLKTSDASEEIKEIRTATISGKVQLTIKSSSGNVNLLSGSSIEIPAWMGISYDTNKFKLDGTSLKTLNDNTITSSGLTIDLTITNIDFTKVTSGNILDKAGQIDFKDVIKMTAFYTKSSSSKETLEFSSNFTPLYVMGGEAKVKPDLSMTFEHYDTRVIQSLVKDTDVANFYDVYINIPVSNNTPLDVEFSSDVIGKKDNKNVVKTKVGPIKSLSAETKTFVVGEKSGILAKNLTDILNKKSDVVAIENFVLTTPEGISQFETDKTYSFDITYSINAPLAFTEDLSISYEYPFDLDIDLEDTEFESAVFSFTVENTMPFTADIEMILLNEDGSQITGAQISTDGKIGAGSLSSPWTRDMSITIRPGNVQHIDSGILLFKMNTDSDHAGQALNINQELKLKNIILDLNGLNFTL